jgi:hypothetical protein
MSKYLMQEGTNGPTPGLFEINEKLGIANSGIFP